MFKKPETLTSLDVIGSFIDLGTDPKAAWCNTKSTPFVASLQTSKVLISPSINLKLESVKNEVIFSLFPVEKLSKQTTSFFLSSKTSQRFEPMKPAPPVTSIYFLDKSIFIDDFFSF